jgi:hypothetical protein
METNCIVLPSVRVQRVPNFIVLPSVRERRVRVQRVPLDAESTPTARLCFLTPPIHFMCVPLHVKYKGVLISL